MADKRKRITATLAPGTPGPPGPEGPQGPPGPDSPVQSVNGRIGDVVAQPGDYDASDIISGVFDPARLGSVPVIVHYAATDRYLRGDGLWVQPPAPISVQDEGVPLAAQPYLNFIGAGVTASVDSANSRINVTIPGAAGGGGAVASVFGRTGAVVAQSGDYTASMVTSAVDQGASYSNPTWITSLAWSKIIGAPATGVATVFGRSGAVVAANGDYTAAQVTNAVDATGSYANPSWITSLAWSKISGAPSVSSYQTPWLSNIDANNFALYGLSHLEIGTPNQDANAVLTIVGTDNKGMVFGGAPGSAPVYIFGNGTGGAIWGVIGAAGMIGSNVVNVPFHICNGGDPHITVLYNGKVGISQKTPNYALDVTGDINLTGVVRINGAQIAAGNVVNSVDTTQTYANPSWITSLAWSKISGAPATGVSSVFTRSGAVVAQAGDYTAAQVTPAGSAGQIQFAGASGISADSNLSWDNTNKRLGIGITPTFPLHVAGGGQVCQFGNTNTPSIRISDASTSLALGIATFANGLITGTAAEDAVMWNTNAAKALVFATNAAIRMYINSSGSVGIGTTGPATALHVLSANGITVDATTGNDTFLRFALAGVSKWDWYYTSSSGSLSVYDRVNSQFCLKIDPGSVGRFYFGAPSAAPTDGNISNNQISFWLNEAGNQLTFRVRYSTGTYKTGTVALA